METIRADGNRRLLNRTGAAVAIMLVLVLASAMGALMLADVPKDNHDIILILITTIANSVIAIVGYFFGSSVSSRNQGDIIATQAATQARLADTAAAVVTAVAPALRPVTPDPGETRYQAAVRLYGVNSAEAKAETPP